MLLSWDITRRQNHEKYSRPIRIYRDSFTQQSVKGWLQVATSFMHMNADKKTEEQQAQYFAHAASGSRRVLLYENWPPSMWKGGLCGPT